MNGYDPRVVANTIIDEALYESQTVTPMKVGKLVFISDGWHLALEDKPLVNQMPQAWEYGPMYPSVFESFKKHGSGPIDSYWRSNILADIEWVSEGSRAREIISQVWRAYGYFSDERLTAVCLKKDSPYKQAVNNKGTGKHVRLSREYTKQYYKKLEKEAKNDLD